MSQACWQIFFSLNKQASLVAAALSDGEKRKFYNVDTGSAIIATPTDVDETGVLPSRPTPRPRPRPLPRPGVEVLGIDDDDDVDAAAVAARFPRVFEWTLMWRFFSSDLSKEIASGN